MTARKSFGLVSIEFGPICLQF